MTPNGPPEGVFQGDETALCLDWSVLDVLKFIALYIKREKVNRTA